VDGILNINKPQGKTSFGTVAVVRRLTAERRVGHAGTLDPLATGVLPVCLGQGTRITEFLVDATKVYHAQIELGRATDTYDTSGQTTQQGDPSGISREKLESALNSFRGLIQQTPPMYSALKHHGKRLYQLARAGIQVARPSRPARIEHLELIDFNPPLVTIEIACGKGTYIRSIAHDLGQILGCGANLKSLVRLRSGHFDIKDAVSLDELENACRHGYWQNYLYPIDVVLLDWAAVIVSEAQGKLVSRGQSLVLEKLANSQKAERDNPSFQSHCRAYTLDGLFLGVLRFNPKSGEWQPRKVLCQLE
jgi:tRNA pseudouridine55 synthase